MNRWTSLLFDGGARGGPAATVLTILLALRIGQFVGWVYMGTHRELSDSPTSMNPRHDPAAR